MDNRNQIFQKIVYLIFCQALNLFSLPLFAADVLSLSEAEQLAIKLDPITKSYVARSESFAEQAISDGQLPDPRLKLGAANFPVDTFDREQEPMTQLQVGIQQSFPPGNTLQYRRERTKALSDIEQSRSFVRTLEVSRNVRIRFMELYYQSAAQRILEENRSLFSQLLNITQRHYAAGRDNQHDVLRAQLELSLIDNRILETIQSRETAIAELGKFIGQENSVRPVQDEFPDLEAVPSFVIIKENLVHHPVIMIEDATLLASDKKISEVEEQFKPTFNIDVTYGERTGTDFEGDSRPDLLSAMLLVDLPIFTDKRQDRRLAAAKKEKIALQFMRTDKLLELRSMAEREYANWNRLNDRLQLFEQRTIADAKMNVDSTLSAYQNDVTDFTTLMRSYLTELETRLDMLRVRVEKAKVQSKLLYLTGEL
ncbi:MAG: TolC family protein [Gammaproteobacteria bacterium]|nr:TolC family protein [Gammaproteobacteria bacterium]NIN62117.1 TolC family protein [Gammaproteobacteria bacterium]NIO63611.1 TolC family protein [Gammaproteobacteria bacterium]NIP49003.1 TolC family protein [Gammaproteobacteria bacterium]NIQ09459.1 TolC family protein [Gammaproteobacteria bacterium]